MPPSQRLLASRIRGFVCNSCLSKLQTPQRQRAPWISQNITTQAVTRSKGVGKGAGQAEAVHSADPAEPVIAVKYWDQTPDGERREAEPPGEDLEEKEFREAVEEEVRDLEQKSGRRIEDMMKDLMGDEKSVEEAMKQNMSRIMEKGPGELGPMGGPEEQMAILEKQGEEMKAYRETIRSYGGIEKIKNLPEEERLKLRETLLAPMRRAMEKSRVSEFQSVPDATPSSQFFSGSPPLQITAPEPAIIQLKAKGEILIPVDAYPEHAHARLLQLNEALYPNRSTSPRRGRAGRGKRKGEDNRQELWRAYIFSRKTLLESPEHVPMRTWHALWNKLAEESPNNLDRMGHIKYLGDDMLKAGVVLHPREHLLYIEALFIDDDHNSAIKRWEDLRSETAAQDTYHLERTHHNTDKRSFQVSYWELGIRMLSLVGKPDQAFEAAEILFGITREPAIYRALLPIIRAYLAVKSESSYRRAWALYVEMRLKMGSQVTMEDYDILISNFFNANQPYLALGVFKDMMLTGNETLAHRDSIASYSKATDTSTSFSKEIKAKEFDWQNAKPLPSLPAQFKNKFFFGSWVKKLIGDGELDLAKKVFDLAEDHGIRASPMHLNGLIGAWYRHGSDKYSAMAEETAWKMIKARIDFVQEREQWNGITSPLRVVESDDLQSSRSIGIVSLTPHATIETFSVLIQQYRRRQRPDLASDLFDALKKAKVKPNTGFLNELLLSDTRAHNMAWAWETYHSLTSTKQVRPDLETFVILWNLEKRNVDPLLGQLSHKHEEVGTKFPPPRELFANMMEQLSAKALRLKAPKELYDMIMLCFCLKADLVGAAVALRALQHHFNAMPSADTVQMIVYSLARLGMKNESGEKPKRLETNSELTQERIAKVARLLDGFKNARIGALERHGINFDHLNSIAKNEQTELMLSDLLRHVSRARLQGDRWGKITAVTLSQMTAEQMGVPDCSPWEASSTI